MNFNTRIKLLVIAEKLKNKIIIYADICVNSDVDECAMNPQICSAADPSTPICLNNVGSFTCTSCSAINPAAISSYFQREGECCRISNFFYFLVQIFDLIIKQQLQNH